MFKNVASIVLVVLLLGTFAFSAKSMRDMRGQLEEALESKEASVLAKGTVLGYVEYKGISGKIYKVPIVSDGKGGKVRWMADVLWADLPIETRLNFAMGGGGLLNPADIGEIWLRFGEWKKSGKYYQLKIGVPEGG